MPTVEFPESNYFPFSLLLEYLYTNTIQKERAELLSRLHREVTDPLLLQEPSALYELLSLGLLVLPVLHFALMFFLLTADMHGLEDLKELCGTLMHQAWTAENFPGNFNLVMQTPLVKER